MRTGMTPFGSCGTSRAAQLLGRVGYGLATLEAAATILSRLEEARAGVSEEADVEDEGSAPVRVTAEEASGMHHQKEAAYGGGDELDEDDGARTASFCCGVGARAVFAERCCLEGDRYRRDDGRDDRHPGSFARKRFPRRETRDELSADELILVARAEERRAELAFPPSTAELVRAADEHHPARNPWL